MPRHLYIIEELRNGSWEASLTFDLSGEPIVCCYLRRWQAQVECHKLEEQFPEGIYRVMEGDFENTTIVDVK